MIKNIILNFGHDEGSQPFYWHFTHQEGYDTRWRAANSLALDCLLSYIEENPIINLYKPPECCELNIKDTDAKFCKKCGNNLCRFNDSFYVEYFENWLLEQSTLNLNYSKFINFFDYNSNWSYNNSKFFNLKEEESLIIYNADRVLPIYLFDNEIAISDIQDENIKIAYSSIFEKIEEIKNNLNWSFDKFVRLTNENETDGIMIYF